MGASLNGNRGMTLLELAVAMIAIGILSAVLIPRLHDLSFNAGKVSAEGIAGALATGSAINLSSRQARSPQGFAIDKPNSCRAEVLGPLLREGRLPEGYIVSSANGPSGGMDDCSAGSIVACEISGPHGGRAAAIIYCSK